MALNPALMGQTAFDVSAALVPPDTPTAPPIFHYDWNRCRVDVVTALQADLTHRTNYQNIGTGDTIYLPYGQGEIHSVYLPTAGGGPVGFLTAGMSGCRLYFDTVQGTHDVVVYHANAIGVGGNAMNAESVALVNALDNQYLAARAWWTGPPNHLNLVAGPNFNRTVYGTPGVLEEVRKQNQSRQNVAFLGGTTVIGELQGGRWHFYWQTYGSCMYDRPWYAPKGWIHGRSHGINNLQQRVLQHGLIWTS
ncbi:MAG: hypothetical protein SFX72_04690 [Isosphaeraceae bacterium]|nr:hypothetical protein [Isosphaeraceae bacterium]